MAMLILDKMNFKTKYVIRYTETYFIIKRSIYQKEITVIIRYIGNNRAPNFIWSTY